MRFEFTPEIEAFRAEIKEFIANELPPEDERPDPGTVGAGAIYKEYTQSFQKKLSEKKWLAMQWPEEYGGGGASHFHQLVYNEEMAYADAPSTNMGISWVAPTLMIYGSDEQKETFIPRITNVDDWWCTLYSEPGSGSDLASLQTRAVRDGDDYVVNGQKIWTSGGHMADWGWLAARTDPEAPKHKGISLFLVDMKSPGVSTRALHNMSGGHEFNEVFFEDVRIPASRMVGEVNRGWYYVAVALDFERSGVGSFATSRRNMEKMQAIAADEPSFLERNPSMRMEIADRFIEANVGRFLAYRITYMQSAGHVPNYEASVSKNYGGELGQRLVHTRMRMLGMLGQLRNGSPYQVMDAANPYLLAVPSTIAGGSSEINRNIIATRGLGLPRG